MTVRTIHLMGGVEHLADGPIKLSCNNLSQLILGLESQVKGFRQEAMKHQEWMVILTDDEKKAIKQVLPENVDMNWSKKNIHVYVAPKLEGAGFEALATWLVANIGVTLATANIIIQVGVSLVLSAVTSLLAPKPKGPGSQAEQNPSFLFNGPVNVQGQGGPVPLVFGVCMVGSTVISSETFVEEMMKPVEQIPEPVAATGNPTPEPPPWQNEYIGAGA